MRNQVLWRALTFLRLMEGDVRPSAREIADHLGVCERSAKRWIAAANEAHVPMPPTVDQLEA